MKLDAREKRGNECFSRVAHDFFLLGGKKIDFSTSEL